MSRYIRDDQTFGGALLSPGTGTNSFKAGPGASATAEDSIAIGHDATATHARAVAIGPDAVTTAADRVTLGLVGGGPTEVKALQVSAGIAAFGAAPPATQPAHIPSPLDVSVDEDVEARAAIDLILAALEGAGIIASS